MKLTQGLVALLDSLLRAGSRITNRSYRHLSDDIECVSIDAMRIVHPNHTQPTSKPKEHINGTSET